MMAAAHRKQGIESRVSRVALSCLLPLFLLLIGPGQIAFVKADDDLPTILAGAEVGYPPFSDVNTEGQATGFSVELLTAALREIGREATFATGPWNEIKDALAQGSIQVLPLVGRTLERELLFDFSVPYLREHGAIVVQKDNDDIRFLSDLKGKRVAVMRADNAEEFLRRSDFGAQIIATDTFEQALFELSAGKHDAVVIQARLASKLIADKHLTNLAFGNGKLESFRQDFCFAVREGDKDLLALLNEGLSEAMSDGTFDALERKWKLSSDNSFKSRLIVGGDQDYPPYEYLDENGRPTGYNVALTRALADIMGIDVEIRLGPWSEIRAALKAGEIDIVHGMFYSPERDKEFEFTQAHTIIDHVAVARKDKSSVPKDIESLKGKNIIVMRGDIMHEWAVEHHLADQLTLVETQQEALRILSAGRGDVALVARVPTLYWIKKNRYSNLMVGSTPLLSPDYCYAAPDTSKHLVDRFSNALEALHDSGKDREIRDTWLGVYEKSYELKRILRYGAVALGVLAILLMLSFAWSRSLRHQVAQRTSELQTSEQRFRQLAELAPIGILLADVDLNLTFTNDRWREMTGIIEAAPQRKTWTSLFPETDRQDLFDKLLDTSKYKTPSTQTSRAVELELQIDTSGNGAKNIYWLIQGIRNNKEETVGYVGATVDISVLRELETQLRQSEKMQAIGQLAGGVAHDLNNQLAVILGFVELLIDDLEDDRLQRYATKIEISATRSQDLVRKLLSFSRKGKIETIAVNLSQLVTEVTEMLERSIDKRIRIVREDQSEDLYVRGDPSQVQNIFLNLAINARDALPEGGTITFRVEAVELDDTDRPPGLMELEPGKYVRVQVMDDGVGMHPELVQRIFEPFFTTKDKGAGTGLGLASVYGSVKNHNGAISVTSDLDRGSVFSVYLPQSDPPNQSIQRDTPHRDTRHTRVMLVDDEDMVREVGAAFLKRLGHTVTELSNGKDALTYFEKHRSEVDLVILDMEMPIMSGQETFAAMREIDPIVKVIVTSGHSFDQESYRKASALAAGTLKKPYRLDEMAKIIKAALS